MIIRGDSRKTEQHRTFDQISSARFVEVSSESTSILSTAAAAISVRAPGDRDRGGENLTAQLAPVWSTDACKVDYR